MTTRLATDRCGVNEALTEAQAYQYARADQGYEGTLEDWLALSDDERLDFERGASGGDEPAPFRLLGR